MFRARHTDREYDAGVRLGEDPVDNHLLTAEADRARFSSLYDVAYLPVRRYLQRAIGVEDADDLAADVFATVWSRWQAVPPEPDKQYAWVFGVAHFKVQETIRARKYARGLLQRLVARRMDVSAAAPDDGVLALQRARDTLALLPRSEREAVALTVLGGLTSAEAAEVLGCSVSAITSRVSRARRRLKEALDAGGEVRP